MNALATSYLNAFGKAADGLPEDLRELVRQVELQKARKKQLVEERKKRTDASTKLVSRVGFGVGAALGVRHAWKTREQDRMLGKLVADIYLHKKLPKVVAQVAAQFKKASADEVDVLRTSLKRKLRTPAQMKVDEERLKRQDRGRLAGSAVLSGLAGAYVGSKATRLFNFGREILKVPGFVRSFREELVRRAKAVAAERVADVPVPTQARVVLPRALPYIKKAL